MPEPARRRSTGRSTGLPPTRSIPRRAQHRDHRHRSSPSRSLLWPRTAKPALALSIAWAWACGGLGEGFGGIFAGKATLLVGAPGPALLYARGARRLATSTPPWGHDSPLGTLGDRVTRWSWTFVGSEAPSALAPFWFPPVYALQGDLEQPGRRAALALSHQRKAQSPRRHRRGAFGDRDRRRS